MNIAKIISILILILSFNITAVCAGVPNWGQDTNCNEFLPKENQWNADLYLAKYKEASDKLSRQIKILSTFRDPSLAQCLKRNYGFSIPFKIENDDRFRNFRLADKNELKGIWCRYPEAERWALCPHAKSREEFLKCSRDAGQCYNNTGKKELCSGYVDRNYSLQSYSSELQKAGRISFEHYCTKEILEEYISYYADKLKTDDYKKCLDSETIDLQVIGQYSGCDKVYANVATAKKISKDYNTFIENGFSDTKRNPKEEVPKLKYEIVPGSGAYRFLPDIPPSSSTINLNAPEKYRNKDLVNDMKTLTSFDNKVYSEFKNNSKALQDAVKKANDRMEVVQKVKKYGLDKVADCLNKSDMNQVFTESFERSGCRLTSEVVLGNLAIEDFENVINGIKNNYSSELAEKANQATFEKNIELFFNYASKDLKDVIQDEEKFCVMLKAFNKFYPGDESGVNGSSAFKDRDIDAVISGIKDPIDTELGHKRYKMGDKYFTDYGETESDMCNKDNTLKSGYKQSFEKVKDSSQPERPTNQEVANDINTLLNDIKIKDSCEQLKKIEDNPKETLYEYQKRMREGDPTYNGDTSGYSYFDPNVPKRIESEATIRSKFFEFVSQHKDSTTHMALLNLIKKQSQSHANNTLRDRFKHKWLGLSHDIKPLDTLGMCYLTTENNQLVTPTITAEDVKELNNELDYQLIRAIGENNDNSFPPGGRDIENCKGSERRDIHRIFKLLMSHPSTLGNMVKAEQDPSKRLLLLNATCKAVECIGDDRDRIIRNHEMLSGAFDIGSVVLNDPIAQGAMRFGKLVTDISKNRFLYGFSEEEMIALSTGFLGEEYYNLEEAFDLLVENIDNMDELDKELKNIVTSHLTNEALTIGKAITADQVTKYINSEKFKTANNEMIKNLLAKSGLDGLDLKVQNAIIKGHLNTVHNIIQNHNNPQKLVLSEVFNQAGVAKVKAAAKAKRLEAIVETMEKTRKDNVTIEGTSYTIRDLKAKAKSLNNFATGITTLTKGKNVSGKAQNLGETDTDVETETGNHETNDDNNTD